MKFIALALGVEMLGQDAGAAFAMSLWGSSSKKTYRNCTGTFSFIKKGTFFTRTSRRPWR